MSHETIGAVPWSELGHAYGPASDVPPLLEAIAKGKAPAVDKLANLIAHQGWISAKWRSRRRRSSSMPRWRSAARRGRRSCACSILDSNMRASFLENRARYGAEAAAWIERALCPGR